MNEAVPFRDLSKQKSSSSGQVPASQGNTWQGNKMGRSSANLLISDDVLNDARNSQKGRSYSRYFSLDAWAERNFPFIIAPKPSTTEKNSGLENIQEKVVNDGRKKNIDNAFQRGKTLRKNSHLTVKPIKLLAYLITMGSRPGDIIADPFCGSGTTCVTAKKLGRGYIGIEREDEYYKIAIQRVNNSLGH